VKDDFSQFPAEVNFEITGRLLEGQKVSCLDRNRWLLQVTFT